MRPMCKLVQKSVGLLLTKYVVGAKANPPKNPRSPPKKGMQMAINMVRAAIVFYNVHSMLQNIIV